MVKFDIPRVNFFVSSESMSLIVKLSQMKLKTSVLGVWSMPGGYSYVCRHIQEKNDVLRKILQSKRTQKQAI